MANEIKGEVCEQLAAACREMANGFEQLGKQNGKDPEADREAWFQAVQALREIIQTARAHEFALTQTLGLPAEGDDSEHSALMLAVKKSLTG